MSKTVILNGREKEVSASDLGQLMLELKVDRMLCVIEIDGKIVNRSDDPASVKIDDGSVIEVLKFTGGG